MAYYRYIIDTSEVTKEQRAEIWKLLSRNSDIHNIVLSNTALYEVFLSEREKMILEDPLLENCRITDITHQASN